MMLFFLSHLSHSVHKIDRIDKIIEFESALDLVFLQFPFRDLFHAILELALFDQVSHTGTTSITRNSFCNGKSSVLKIQYSAKSFSRIEHVYRTLARLLRQLGPVAQHFADGGLRLFVRSEKTESIFRREIQFSTRVFSNDRTSQRQEGRSLLADPAGGPRDLHAV